MLGSLTWGTHLGTLLGELGAMRINQSMSVNMLCKLQLSRLGITGIFSGLFFQIL